MHSIEKHQNIDNFLSNRRSSGTKPIVGIDKGVWLGGLEPLVVLQDFFHGGSSAKLGAEAPWP